MSSSRSPSEPATKVASDKSTKSTCVDYLRHGESAQADFVPLSAATLVAGLVILGVDAVRVEARRWEGDAGLASRPVGPRHHLRIGAIQVRPVLRSALQRQPSGLAAQRAGGRVQFVQGNLVEPMGKGSQVGRGREAGR